MYPAYQISKLNKRRTVTSPQMRCDVTKIQRSSDDEDYNEMKVSTEEEL